MTGTRVNLNAINYDFVFHFSIEGFGNFSMKWRVIRRILDEEDMDYTMENVEQIIYEYVYESIERKYDFAI
jgi:hypothetical protein|tara:strand:+ start:1760 stop:1972 length:213 start_codon:yes stop_codon:yes gene_type:complete